ncbi:hypothetical protein PSECIP111951_03216 [Pseudoalteromonas holothuriae]|uniref:Uncharacterized protein n=1 Tax=Pseudoalteromonas holothuriae TaxID=2963714 RepID=A0A9W4VU32_9GAMM|nr:MULTISPECIES: hypothetical protein [unclassified Pseudoalteromonas]CAH9063608.1 hypothetical protein PSECIP111854_03257 [Pseudoalteromonas sp. CIP111854]CAH9064775.1 hypothetical protein PSECIP111951_03216 [Pseudoalteromonas sp. CIP111951]
MTQLTTAVCNWVDDCIAQGADKEFIFKVLSDEDPDALFAYIESAHTNKLMIKESDVSEHEQTHLYDIPQNILFLPNAKECLIGDCRLLKVDGFLNELETNTLLNSTRMNMLNNSLVTELSHCDDYKSTKTYDLSLVGDVLVKDIDTRICKLVGVDRVCSSPLYLQTYECFQSTHQRNAMLDMSIFSVVIYLSQDMHARATQFPQLNSDLVFEQGDFVFWQNKLVSGQSDEQMCYLHNPNPGKQQHMLVKYFYSYNNRLLYKKTLNEMVENYTLDGFKKVTLEEGFVKKLTDFYHNNKELDEEELQGEGDFIKSEVKHISPSHLLKLSDSMCTYIHQTMQPLLSSWAGVELEPTYVYGIRTYHNGATLKPHRDRIATHVISCIINVHQDIDIEWPLQIEDNLYRTHSMILKPGEAIFYESARLEHSRVEPLVGRAYANIFCHFIPTGYIPPQL